MSVDRESKTSEIIVAKTYPRFNLVRCSFVKYVLLIIGLLQIQPVFGQLSQGDVLSINKQILYANESIHGSLVLHRIYESFNQDINKYVDLPSYDLNNYGNQDLPDDIFEDPERWFYQQSPLSIYQDIQKENSSADLWRSTNGIVKNINTLTELLNRDRKEIEQIINSENLNQLTTIQKVYGRLETVVGYYDSFESYVVSLERNINKEAFNNNLPEKKKQVYRALLEIHLDIKKAIRQIGDDNQSGVINVLSKIDKEKNWLKTCISELSSVKEKQELAVIMESIVDVYDYLDEYLNNSKVPEEYSLFGKGYYYQNVLLLTKINRYGNGYVPELNNFFARNNWSVLHFIEEPHFLKIIYPELTPKDLLAKPIPEEITLEELKNDKLAVTNKIIPPKAPPVDSFFLKSGTKKEEKLEPKRPPVVITGSHVLYVDSLEFEIELYDHLIKDGDRVSINVNGEWVFNDISLEKEPQRIKLRIKADEENYIMVQAINIGWRPPNTVGLRYRSNGRVENFLLKTDLNSTELVQIKYRKN